MGMPAQDFVFGDPMAMINPQQNLCAGFKRYDLNILTRIATPHERAT
jgi:hypothetical protein